jgi:hypothetical protein
MTSSLAGAQPPSDACTLVTRDEVQQIVGVPLAAPEKRPGTSGPDVTFTQCAYASEDGMKSLSIGYRVSKKPDGGAPVARQAAVDAGMRVEDVAGLGDAAFWTGMQLQAFRGTNVQVVVSVFGIEGAKDKAVAVARRALAKP